MKRTIVLFLAAVLFALTGCSGGVAQEEYDKVAAERDEARNALEKLQQEYDELEGQYEDVLIERNALLIMMEDGYEEAEPPEATKSENAEEQRTFDSWEQFADECFSDATLFSEGSLDSGEKYIVIGLSEIEDIDRFMLECYTMIMTAAYTYEQYGLDAITNCNLRCEGKFSILAMYGERIHNFMNVMTTLTMFNDYELKKEFETAYLEAFETTNFGPTTMVSS